MKKALLITASLLALGACTPTVTQHGNILKDEQIQEIKPGEHRRSDVLRLLGSPTTESPFDGNIWYYIGQNKEKRGILDPKVTEERIVAVRFAENGTVQSLEDIAAQRIPVPVSGDKTPTHGNEVTILQQFLGNLGKFNPPSAEE